MHLNPRWLLLLLLVSPLPILVILSELKVVLSASAVHSQDGDRDLPNDHILPWWMDEELDYGLLNGPGSKRSTPGSKNQLAGTQKQPTCPPCKQLSCPPNNKTTTNNKPNIPAKSMGNDNVYLDPTLAKSEEDCDREVQLQRSRENKLRGVINMKPIVLPIYLDKRGGWPYVIMKKGRQQVRQMRLILDLESSITVIKSSHLLNKELNFTGADPEDDRHWDDSSSSFVEPQPDEDQAENQAKYTNSHLKGVWFRNKFWLGIWPVRTLVYQIFFKVHESQYDADEKTKLNPMTELQRPWPKHSQTDGILGLGMRNLVTMGTCNDLLVERERIFMNNILAQPFIPHRRVSLFFNATDSKSAFLVIGSWDKYRIRRNSLAWAPVHYSNRWSIKLNSVRLQGHDDTRTRGKNESSVGILSSMTPHIVGPKRQVNVIQQKLRQLGLKDTRNLSEPIDCADSHKNLPPLLFKLDFGSSVVIPASRYIMTRQEPDPSSQTTPLTNITICRFAIRKHARVRADGLEKPWFLGRAFLVNRYTILDYANKRVGFAEINQ